MGPWPTLLCVAGIGKRIFSGTQLGVTFMGPFTNGDWTYWLLRVRRTHTRSEQVIVTTSLASRTLQLIKIQAAIVSFPNSQPVNVDLRYKSKVFSMDGQLLVVEIEKQHGWDRDDETGLHYNQDSSGV